MLSVECRYWNGEEVIRLLEEFQLAPPKLQLRWPFIASDFGINSKIATMDFFLVCHTACFSLIVYAIR